MNENGHRDFSKNPPRIAESTGMKSLRRSTDRRGRAYRIPFLLIKKPT